MNKKQYRNWKQIQDDKIIREAEMKRNREESPIVRELKTAGNIKEAAAVFSHEGFIFLVEQLGDIVVKELEPMINNMLNKKVTEIFEGLTEGFKRSLESKIESPEYCDKSFKDRMVQTDFEPVDDRAINETSNKVLTTFHKPVLTEPNGKKPVHRHKWTEEEKKLVMETVREYEEQMRPLVEAFKEIASVIPDVGWKSVSTRYYVWRDKENGK